MIPAGFATGAGDGGADGLSYPFVESSEDEEESSEDEELEDLMEFLSA